MGHVTVKGVALLTLTLVLSGCASWFSGEETRREMEKRRQEVLDRIEREPEKRTKEREFVSSTPWLAGENVHKEQAYPELESAPAVLTENDITLPEIASRLGDLSGVNIKLDPDLGKLPDSDEFQVDEEGEGGGGGSGSGSGGGQGSSGLGSSNPLSPQLGRSGQNDRLTGLVMKPLTSEINIDFDTNLKRALDNLASRFSVHWDYDRQNNEVTFYRTDTRSFQVDFAGDVEGEVQVGSDDDADSVMSESLSYENSAGTWDQIEKGFQSVLSPWGDVELSESSGSITVTDTPNTLESAKEYADQLNDVLSRQVYLEFDIISVNMEDGNSFQASWDGVLNEVMDARYGAGVDSSSGVMSEQGNSLNVVRNKNDAEAALQMLATKANVSQVTSRSVTTMSNQPAPIRVVNDNTYVSGVNELEGNNSDSGVTTEVETDTINTGFSATLLPKIKNSNELQLQVSMELSSLVSLDTVGDSLVQAPERDRQTTVQRAWLSSGETLVMSGFSQDQDQLDLSGTGDASFWGFGGGRSRQSNERVLLIMVTPHVRSGDHLG